MIRIISFFIFICCTSITLAAKIPASLQKHVPKDWEIIAQANGDLNSDGQVDTALIIQSKNPKMLNRKLVVFFKQENSFRQIITQDLPKWTYRADENCVDDALLGGGLEIKNNILDIIFNDMNTCSNWYGQASTYRFKWINSQFKLIGFEYWFINKTDGELKTYSGNFLTKRLKTTIGNEFKDNVKPKESWKKLTPIHPNTLAQIKFEQGESFLKQMIK